VEETGRFWERLVVDAVAVVVLGFVLQGLWFAGTAALADWRPDLELALRKASERFLAAWIVLMLAGLGWAARRAWVSRRVGDPGR